MVLNKSIENFAMVLNSCNCTMVKRGKYKATVKTADYTVYLLLFGKDKANFVNLL